MVPELYCRDSLPGDVLSFDRGVGLRSAECEEFVCAEWNSNLFLHESKWIFVADVTKFPPGLDLCCDIALKTMG